MDTNGKSNICEIYLLILPFTYNLRFEDYY